MRLIDAEWLKDLYQPYENYNDKELAVPIGAILANIDDAPTIDAVSVVRCKDCKWSEPNEFDDYDCRCHIPTFRVNADGFCSYGEREGE